MFKGYIDLEHKAFNQDLYDFVNQFPHTVFYHTSGHASKACIEKICGLINPAKAIIPIHKEGSFDLIDLPPEAQAEIYNDSVLIL